MATHWTEKRRAVANIGEELARRGWKLHGYHEDQSDMMTDYWCPSSWDGVATKDGFIVCVDVSTYTLRKAGKDGWPQFQATPGNSKWHVERNGRILAHGVGIYAAGNFNREGAETKRITDKLEAACVLRAATTPTIAPVAPETGVEVRENEQHDGVEVVFANRPADAVLETLKAAGFRWSRPQRLWYAKRNATRLALARSLTNVPA